MAADDSEGLSIKLHGNKTSYSPGDTIQGSLQLRLNRDSAVGKVTIHFLGRSKSKIVQSNGQSTSTFRGRVELFDITRILHDGHYTHKSGILSWPFEFCIPDSVDNPASENKWETHDGFLSNVVGETQMRPLPPSFRFVKSGSSKGWHVFTLYHIQAMISEPQDRSVLKPKKKISTRPIHVLPCSSDIPIDFEDPRYRLGHSETLTVRSLRLLPEYRGGLSLSQRVGFLFGRSNTPRFSFDIDVSYPATLQTYHPQPLPFVVAAIPKTDTESTTIQPSMLTFHRYPPLKVRHFQLFLRATTKCRCPSVLSDITADTSYDIVLADQQFGDLLLGMRSLAWDQKNEAQEDAPTSIDFGKECNVHITTDTWYDVEKRKVKTPSGALHTAQSLVIPSFVTHNIYRSYHLAWNIELECAGETIRLKDQSQQGITVVGPAKNESGGLPLTHGTWEILDDIENSDDEQAGQWHLQEDTLPAYTEIGTTALPTTQRSTLKT